MLLFLVALGVVCLLITFIAWKLGKKKRLEKPIDFKERFYATKTVLIDDIPFVIRKINVLDYLEGGKVLAESFSTYKSGKNIKDVTDIDTGSINKLKKYLTDIICVGVVKPKFIRGDTPSSPDEIPIEDLFRDWILAQKLAQEIFDYTHGKKK